MLCPSAEAGTASVTPWERSNAAWLRACAVVLLSALALRRAWAEAWMRDRSEGVEGSREAVSSSAARVMVGFCSVCKLPRMTYSQVQNMNRGSSDPAMIAVRTCDAKHTDFDVAGGENQGNP